MVCSPLSRSFRQKMRTRMKSSFQSKRPRSQRRRPTRFEQWLRLLSATRRPPRGPTDTVPCRFLRRLLLRSFRTPTSRVVVVSVRRMGSLPTSRPTRVSAIVARKMMMCPRSVSPLCLQSSKPPQFMKLLDLIESPNTAQPQSRQSDLLLQILMWLLHRDQHRYNREMTIRIKPSNKKTKTQRANEKSRSRLIYVNNRSNSPVELKAFLVAARATRGISRVHQRVLSYPVLFGDDWLQKTDMVANTEYTVSDSFSTNFTIPTAILSRLEAVIKAKKTSVEQSQSVDLHGLSSSYQYVTRFKGASSIRGFSEENAAMFREYYDLLRRCEAYELDMAWLKRQCDEDASEMRSENVAAMEKCAFDTLFELGASNINKPTSISLSDVVGRLARTVWLNDAVLVHVLRRIADDVDNVLVLDCLRPLDDLSRPTFKVPPHRIAPRQTILLPVNLSKSHWCLICVSVTEMQDARVLYYDSLVNPSNINLLHNEWTQHGERFLRSWIARDCYDSTNLVISTPRMLSVPRQPSKDGNNCGVYCLAVALDFATERTAFTGKNELSPVLIEHLRLRALWTIFCSGPASTTPKEEESAVVMKTYDASIAKNDLVSVVDRAVQKKKKI